MALHIIMIYTTYTFFERGFLSKPGIPDLDQTWLQIRLSKNIVSYLPIQLQSVLKSPHMYRQAMADVALVYI